MVAAAVDEIGPAVADGSDQRALADILAGAAGVLAPGWLGADLGDGLAEPEAGDDLVPRYVRIGVAEPSGGAHFPVIVPLLGTGHLALDADARDPRVAAVLRCLLLRVLAAAPAGSVLVRGVTAADSAEAFTPFLPLAEVGLFPPPATDRLGLLAVLAEAERWVRPATSAAGRGRRRDRSLLVVVAALPDPVEPADLARLAALAGPGAAAGLHLIVAGWPAAAPRPPDADPEPAPRPEPMSRPGPASRSAADQVPATRAPQAAAWPGTPPTVPTAVSRVGASTGAPVTRPAVAVAAGRPGSTAPTTRAESSGRTGAGTAAHEPGGPVAHEPAGTAAHEPGGPAVEGPGRSRPPAAASGHREPPPLAAATTILVREAHALVGDPPGGSFGARGPRPVATGLASPVRLDGDPPPELVARVCADLAERSALGCRPRLADLLPESREYWAQDAAEGLTTVVGHDGDTPVTLRFAELTPHWLLAGRPGAGTSAFLANVLYGLGARYRPESLVVHLLSVRPDPVFGEFLPSQRNPSWLPHVRTAGVAADREYAMTLLRELDAELDRRAARFEGAGVGRLTELPGPDRPPRVLCVLDGAPLLLAGSDRLSRESLRLLESVARRGRSYGVHLALVGRPTELPGGAYPDQLLAQCPVRVALPGGGDVLEPTNDAAAGLPLGAAVVNTAGGLGGPRGATRGHERVVRFPDPAIDAADRDELRNRLWLARPDPDGPRVFDGAAPARLADDPTYRAVLTAGSGPPLALLGRAVDARTVTASFALDDAPGRHLAVVGRSPVGATVLAEAARSVAAAHPPGGTRFAVATLVAEAEAAAETLVRELRRRHEVNVVDVAQLAKELDDDRPGYLVVFGMDAAGPAELPPESARAGLRGAPGRGVHLLSWWRRTRRLVELAGDGSLTEYVAGLLLLDLPPIEAEYLLGREADWKPAPGRATLADRATGEVRLIVPFGGGVR
ncbi:hypothetical protein CIK06_27060 [Plantactinospora sp. KBS50]|nr:hypothetical protein CIK06_27060 [Plantactinospora sp. KBS50]